MWVLVAVTIGAGLFALWANHAVELARYGQEDLQRERDLLATRSVLLYLLATRPVNLGGLTMPGRDEKEGREKPVFDPMAAVSPPTGSELALDDRPYKGVGKTYFAVQDEGGLFGLNVFQPLQLNRLLGLLGIPPIKRDPMIDKLLDYTDRDSLHRLNGAESVHYLEQGLPPPADRFLLTSWEARNVLDWGKHEELWKNNRLPRLTTVARGGMPNFNTAPSLVLQSVAGIDDETARKLIRARENKPFSGLSDINQAAGKALPLDPMGLFFLPTSRLRITIRAEGDPLMREIHVQMTPVAANGAPWLIDYELSIPLIGKQQGAEIQNTGCHLFTAPLFAGENRSYSTGQ